LNYTRNGTRVYVIASRPRRCSAQRPGDIHARSASRLRASDCIGRFGSEEFLVVRPDTELDGAAPLAAALSAAAEAAPVSRGAHSLPVSLCIGASGRPADCGRGCSAGRRSQAAAGWPAVC